LYVGKADPPLDHTYCAGVSHPPQAQVPVKVFVCNVTPFKFNCTVDDDTPLHPHSPFKVALIEIKVLPDGIGSLKESTPLFHAPVPEEQA